MCLKDKGDLCGRHNTPVLVLSLKHWEGPNVAVAFTYRNNKTPLCTGINHGLINSSLTLSQQEHSSIARAAA